MIINKASLDSIRKMFKKLFDLGAAKAEPQWPRVAMKVPSSTKTNIYGWLGATTRVRKWIGDRVIQNLKTHDFSITNEDWENTVAVDANDIEDDNLGVYAPLVTDMAADSANFPDELVFDLMSKAFETTCYDGQYLIDTDHPVLDENGDEQSVSNHGGGAGAAWFLIDDSKAIKPFILQMRKEFVFTDLTNPDDANVFMKNEYLHGTHGRMNVGVALWQLIYGSKQDLTADNFSSAKTAMKELKGDNGRPLRVMPKLLVVGPSNEDAAKKIAKAEKNDAGATNIYQGTVEVMVVPWLN